MLRCILHMYAVYNMSVCQCNMWRTRWRKRTQRAIIYTYTHSILMEATRAQAREVRELLEDTIEYFCDENMVSGEVAWTMVECVAVAKLAQMEGRVS